MQLNWYYYTMYRYFSYLWNVQNHYEICKNNLSPLGINNGEEISKQYFYQEINSVSIQID